jgi:hypothetical protein
LWPLEQVFQPPLFASGIALDTPAEDDHDSAAPFTRRF